MKKLIKLAAVIAAMAMALSFVACDDDDDDDDDNTSTETESTETVTGTLEGTSDSDTLTAPDGVSKIEITMTYTSTISTVEIYLGNWAWEVKFGDSGATLTIDADGTTCDDWLYDKTNTSSSTSLTLSDIVDTYDGKFTLYIYNDTSVSADYEVVYYISE